MKKKGYSKGGKAGGKLEMVKDPATGKMVPAYAMDGEGSDDMARGKKGMKPQDMRGAAKNLKNRGAEGPDQPIVKKRKSLKGKERNVSPEEVRARKEEKVEMQGGGPVPPKKKGYAKGGKVRGAGIARKGTRPCKMR